MEAKSFLEVAKRLQISDEEADRRTSVSRAYYAVFNQVKCFLADANIKLPKDAAGHKKAHQYLLYSGIQEARKLAEALSSLRNNRNDADYELLSPKFLYDKKNCGLSCFKALQFFERFDKINRASIVNGILDYKRKTNN